MILPSRSVIVSPMGSSSIALFKRRFSINRQFAESAPLSSDSENACLYPSNFVSFSSLHSILLRSTPAIIAPSFTLFFCTKNQHFWGHYLFISMMRRLIKRFKAKFFVQLDLFLFLAFFYRYFPMVILLNIE